MERFWKGIQMPDSVKCSKQCWLRKNSKLNVYAVSNMHIYINDLKNMSSIKWLHPKRYSDASCQYEMILTFLLTWHRFSDSVNALFKTSTLHMTRSVNIIHTTCAHVSIYCWLTTQVLILLIATIHLTFQASSGAPSWIIYWCSCHIKYILRAIMAKYRLHAFNFSGTFLNRKCPTLIQK